MAICHGHDWLGVRGGRQDKNTRLSCLTFCNSQMRVIRLWFSHLDGNWNQNTQTYLFLREESNVILWFFQNLNLCWLYCFSWHLSCLPFRQKSHLALRSSRLTQQMLMLSMTVTVQSISYLRLCWTKKHKGSFSNSALFPHTLLSCTLIFVNPDLICHLFLDVNTLSLIKVFIGQNKTQAHTCSEVVFVCLLYGSMPFRLLHVECAA